MTPMRIVTPYRPFPAESVEHLALGPFDWVGAIEMLRASAQRFCQCETVAITDVDTTLPGPTFHYRTTERTLMLWILEVALCYLKSSQFDCDTVMCSPDALVFCDLRPWFAGEIGMVVRPQHAERPILNGLQWWPVKSRHRLVELYGKALSIAQNLSYDLRVWGADSKPFEKLLKPLFPGCGPRKYGYVANLVDSRAIMQPLTTEMIEAMDRGEQIDPPQRVLDFRFLRKREMRRYFEAAMRMPVSA